MRRDERTVATEAKDNPPGAKSQYELAEMIRDRGLSDFIRASGHKRRAKRPDI
jgi:hypothetical protein